MGKNSKLYALQTAVDRAGGIMALARFLKVSHQVVHIWAQRGWVPLGRAVQIEKKFDVPRLELIDPRIAKLLNC